MSDPSGKISLVIAGGELTLGVDEDGIMTVQQGVSSETIRTWIPPDMADDVNLVDWSRQPGSHYSVHMTADLIELLSQQVTAGARAVVVFCGSGAIEEMAYLADLLWIYPQPLVFAATYTPPCIPGSDALNVIRESLQTASARETWGQGVLLCSGGKIFAGSDVIERANYGRCGFHGNFREAIGAIINGHVYFWQMPKRSRIFETNLAPARNVEMIYASLGAGEDLVQYMADTDPCPIDGLVIAGFGGGSVYPAWVPHIRKLIRNDIPVVVVSRCPQGCVLDTLSYEGSFLKLKEMGALSGGFMTPWQARLKLAVGIGAGLRGEELQDYLLD